MKELMNDRIARLAKAWRELFSSGSNYNVKNITHTDLDGVGCYILLSQLCTCTDVCMEGYSSIDSTVKTYLDELKDGEFLFITDITVSEETADIIDKYLEEHPKRFVIQLDHHPKAKLIADSHDWAVYKPNNDEEGYHSGTTLTFEFISNILPESCKEDAFRYYENFSYLVSLWDTWAWKDNTLLPDEDRALAKQINDLYYIYSHEDFFTFITNGRFKYDTITLNDTEKAILKIEEERTARIIDAKEKNMEIRQINRRMVGIVFIESKASEICNAICERHPEIDLCCAININSGLLSFRSAGDKECKTLAELYGGGGHNNSSGGQFDGEKIRSLIADKVFSNDNIDINTYIDQYFTFTDNKAECHKLDNTTKSFTVSRKLNLVNEVKLCKDAFNTGDDDTLRSISRHQVYLELLDLMEKHSGKNAFDVAVVCTFDDVELVLTVYEEPNDMMKFNTYNLLAFRCINNNKEVIENNIDRIIKELKEEEQ